MYNIETTGQAAGSSLAVPSSKVQRRSRHPPAFRAATPTYNLVLGAQIQRVCGVAQSTHGAVLVLPPSAA